MERKAMVKKLGDTLGVKPRYLNVPTFAYEIETAKDTYTIDRQGIITNKEGRELTMDEVIASEQEAPAPKEEPVVELDADSDSNYIEVTFPLEAHTPQTLKNWIATIASKGHLIAMAFKHEAVPLNEEALDAFQQEDLESIPQLAEWTRAFGEEMYPRIAIDPDKDILTVRVDTPIEDPAYANAWVHLADVINRTVLAQKRVRVKRAQEDNPKYSLRTWLIRMGMNGPDYKDVRKTLLANVEGNAAFRKGGE
ncbi:hypothetical protein [Salisediminibacterium selenitireducens]|uniref:Virulence-related protein n=1 Tax=Bacillus selenitireducens (strain ATCC 700615 / DSM 15326 / MLS10) TaxID=439292 RepID=D6XZZ2_BACIE|nr:hypothetical protein [Salisediminibacterium selenitireducens]ADI00494.1 hypothetical protein Bsel_3012 [[Bacillus] selenitireducens MLS10]